MQRPAPHRHLAALPLMRSCRSRAIDGAAASSPAGDRAPGVIAPPPLIYLGGLAIGLGIQPLLPATHVPGAVRWPLAGALLLAGGSLARSFVRAFRAARTPVSPYSASTSLVTDGPYRISRNPGYLGMALTFAGIAIACQSLWALAVLLAVLAIVDRGVIAREERYLRATFGEPYLAYTRRTRRWL